MNDPSDPAFSDEAFTTAALRARAFVRGLESWSRSQARFGFGVVGGTVGLCAAIRLAVALELPEVVLGGLLLVLALAGMGLVVVCFRKARQILALFDQVGGDFECVSAVLGEVLGKGDRQRTSLTLPRSRATLGNPGLLDRFFPMQIFRALLGVSRLELFEDTVETRRVSVLASGLGTSLRVQTTWGGQLVIGLEAELHVHQRLRSVEVPPGLDAKVWSSDAEMGAALVAAPELLQAVADLRAIPGVSIPMIWAGPEFVEVSLQPVEDTTPQAISAAVDSCQARLADLAGWLEARNAVAKPIVSPAWARRLSENPGSKLRFLYGWFDLGFVLCIVTLRWSVWIALAGLAFTLLFGCLGGAILGIVTLVQGGLG